MVDFKHGEQIVNITWDFEDQKPYTYIGEKGFGGGKQYVFYDPKEDRAYHFTDRDADDWVKYVPGLWVGRTYQFNESGSGNTYTILFEYKNPDTGARTWYAEVKNRDSKVVSSVSPYPLTEVHVERLKEV